ncbi:Transposable element Tcb1 transposase, partial [Geodia barretti]
NLGSSFGDVIWTDETSVQLESHRRFHCYKKGQKPRYKPRPKHPVKVHVWAGISRRGATGVCIFEGIMTASVYIKILEEFLVPFIRDVYPSGHEFMQDNDPKHTSRQAKEFFSQHSINWWRTPPESPDANPIENLWHELKEYIRRVTKPKRKEELVSGILRFWSTVTPSKCQKYISHLDKVIPEMIRVNGEATGF